MTLWGEGEEKAGVKQSQVGQEEEDCRDQINIKYMVDFWARALLFGLLCEEGLTLGEVVLRAWKETRRMMQFPWRLEGLEPGKSWSHKHTHQFDCYLLSSGLDILFLTSSRIVFNVGSLLFKYKRYL